MPLVMQIEGIRGAGNIPGHEGWLLLNSFSWSGSRDVISSNRPDGRIATIAVSPQLRAVKVSRTSDSVSPEIWNLMTSSAKKRLEFNWLRTATDGLGAYLKMVVEGAQIVGMSEISTFAEPDEAIDFTYQKITLTVINVKDALTGPQDVVSYTLPNALRG